MQNLVLRRVQSSRADWTDFAGIAASLGCAIHCAAMPFVIGYLPNLGLTWMAREGFHQWTAVVLRSHCSNGIRSWLVSPSTNRTRVVGHRGYWAGVFRCVRTGTLLRTQFVDASTQPNP